MKKNALSTAIKFAMGVGTVAAVPFAGTALAEEETLTVEEVVVTGSRIKTDGFESASPVAVSTAVEIKATGINKIEDYLNSLPQLEASDNSSISNGASGNATLDLRGMGANRTLVLINGRRMSGGGAYNSAAADVNQIPTSMIERIEVLTGGASTVYGADAVAGVVNFVLREDFEGVEIDFGTSGYMHDNDNSYIQGLMDARNFEYPSGSDGIDGRADTVDLIIGSKFAEDKGHAVMFATWRKGEELRQEARDYSSCALNSAGTACGGSGNAIIPNFYISQLNSGGTLDWDTYEYWTLDSNSNFIPSSGNIYNYAPINHFMRPDEKWTFGTTIKYEINPNMRAYGEAMYMDYKSAAQIAESGTFFAEEYKLPYDSPLLNDSQRQALTDTWGLQSGDEFAVYIGKRNVEGGPRASVFSNNSMRVVAGLEGAFNDKWDYDFSFQRSVVNSTVTYINDFFAPNITDALENGTYSVFTYQGVTSEEANALTGVGILNATIDQEIYSGIVNGETGLQLPSANAPISVAVGFERRDISFDRDSDTVFEEGQLLGQGGPTASIAGSYDVTDMFFEAAIPVMDNLTAELGYRTSDYSTVGTADAYKFQVSFRPMDKVRIRTGYNRAVRSPSVIEMFAPSNQGLWNGDDACAGDTPVYTLEQCARTGVTADQYGNIVPSPANQYNGIFGGNQQVEPEVADTYTFGVVVDPTQNLTFSVDWWSIELEDAIGTVGAQEILKQCAENANQQYCDLINRGNAGTLWLGTSGYINSTTQNLGELNWEGVDLAVAYTTDIAGGQLRVKFSGSHMIKKEVLTLPGDETTRYDCVGVVNSQCFPTPDWRHTLTATYYGDNWNAGVKWRYYGGVDYTDESQADTIADDNMDAQSYIDITGGYQVTENIYLSGGARNLFDKEPPMVGGTLSTNANTYAGFYDTLGRYVYANATFTF